jgi:glycosyltransferase involved in cell wall biosynthesis
MQVSVIVPAYNARKSIGKCLDALMSQDYQRAAYEVIVVDDGSTDGTGDVVRTYPVKYLFQTNQGPATARNAGARTAQGEILLFTDADCVPTANWIQEMARPFEDRDVAAVKGAYLTRQKSITARFAQLEFEERFEMLKKAESIDMVDTYSAGYRKEVFLRLGGFDTSFPVANNEDTELSYRMSKLGLKMIFSPRAVVYHLNHPDSLKRYARLKFWRGYWRCVVYKKFPDKMLKDTYTPQALKLQIGFLFLSALSLPFAAIFPRPGVYPFVFSAMLLCLFMATFTVSALRKDPLVGICAPFLLCVRAGALGFGMVWGMFRSRKIR